MAVGVVDHPSALTRRKRPQSLPSCGRLCLEDLIALGQSDPGLLAAGPEMRCRAQPGRIVQRACSHAPQAVIRTRCTANPRATFRANPTGHHASAISSPLHCSRLYPREAETPGGNDDAHREGAAGQTLAIDARARVDQLRRFGDLIADLAALTAAGLWKFHGMTPPPFSGFCNDSKPIAAKPAQPETWRRRSVR
jgi:hypothetical protein